MNRLTKTICESFSVGIASINFGGMVDSDFLINMGYIPFIYSLAGVIIKSADVKDYRTINEEHLSDYL